MATTPTKRSARLHVVRSLVVDASVLGGAGLLTYGAWLAWAPLGFIVGGLVLLAAGLNGARR